MSRRLRTALRLAFTLSVLLATLGCSGLAGSFAGTKLQSGVPFELEAVGTGRPQTLRLRYTSRYSGKAPRLEGQIRAIGPGDTRSRWNVRVIGRAVTASSRPLPVLAPAPPSKAGGAQLYALDLLTLPAASVGEPIHIRGTLTGDANTHTLDGVVTISG